MVMLPNILGKIPMLGIVLLMSLEIYPSDFYANEKKFISLKYMK